MKRIIIALLTLSSIMTAETVYLTPHGKTFHTSRTCMSLAKSPKVLEADDKTATAHGLHECGICAKRKSKRGASKKANNSSFATEVK